MQLPTLDIAVKSHNRLKWELFSVKFLQTDHTDFVGKNFKQLGLIEADT